MTLNQLYPFCILKGDCSPHCVHCKRSHGATCYHTVSMFIGYFFVVPAGTVLFSPAVNGTNIIHTILLPAYVYVKWT